MSSSVLQHGEMMMRTDVAVFHRNAFRIGDVSVLVRGNCERDVVFDDRLARFQIEPTRGDVNISVKWVDGLKSFDARPLFDSGSVWRVFEHGNSLVFDFTTPALGADPYRRLTISRDFGDGELLLNSALLDGQRDEFYPFEYPLDELLMTHVLAVNGAVELHGCGLVDSERGGYLFVGHSGAGKSTMMRLWRSLRNVRVLSDDRVVLRRTNEDLWIYGTPWHGEPGLDDQEKSRINAIFVLEHGTANEIVPLSPAQAVGELFARCFVPMYDRECLRGQLKFLHEVTESLPCFRFSFVPDASALEKVLSRD
jgi:hypothetical protein